MMMKYGNPIPNGHKKTTKFANIYKRTNLKNKLDWCTQ